MIIYRITSRSTFYVKLGHTDLITIKAQMFELQRTAFGVVPCYSLVVSDVDYRLVMLQLRRCHATLRLLPIVFLV